MAGLNVRLRLSVCKLTCLIWECCVKAQEVCREKLVIIDPQDLSHLNALPLDVLYAACKSKHCQCRAHATGDSSKLGGNCLLRDVAVQTLFDQAAGCVCFLRPGLNVGVCCPCCAW